MSSGPSVAILGAGNGGCAAAADLGRRGFDVRLFNRTRATIEPIIERGGIEMTGSLGDAFVALDNVSSDIDRVLDGADVVMLCVPTSAHPFYAELLAERLPEGQIVFLNPGHMGGGLYMAHEIYRLAGRTDVRVCESTTLSYGCRMKSPTLVNIMFTLRNLAFAAFPGKDQEALYEVVSQLYPELIHASSVLETGFLCINSVEHPPQAIFNAGWLEFTAGDYYFYREGTTPSVGRVIDVLDLERQAVAEKVGVPTKPFVQYFHESGYTSAEAARIGTAHAALQDSEPNRWIKAPPSLDHRYLHEDVGRGLVPWAEIALSVGVPTPVMDGMISFASAMNGMDYRTQGMTLDLIGMADLDPSEYDTFLMNGITAKAAS